MLSEPTPRPALDNMPATGRKGYGGARGSLEPPAPLPMRLHTVCMEYSECLPTLSDPLAERTWVSQARDA